VSEIQRVRITGGMSELVRERGATRVTVADVVARSGVSRRTFYELFADREDCFLAAFDRAIAHAAEVAVPAYQSGERWRERIRAALQALLGFFDAEPDEGFLCVVGALGSGSQALERRSGVLEALVTAVHEGRRESRGATQPDRLVAEGVVGAVLAVIHARMLQRDSKPLRTLLNPLLAMIVLPYLGPAAAERERARPTPRTPKPAPPRSIKDPLRHLDMRLTYRTIRVLVAIAANPSANNRQISTDAGIADQGQISKLLGRLQNLGLITNGATSHAKGEPNAWTLTTQGEDVIQAVNTQTANT
jgi:AcrR family transcriptional regulator/DNA-binding MarR family transcriptional regulator